MNIKLKNIFMQKSVLIIASILLTGVAVVAVILFMQSTTTSQKDGAQSQKNKEIIEDAVKKQDDSICNKISGNTKVGEDGSEIKESDAENVCRNEVQEAEKDQDNSGNETENQTTESQHEAIDKKLKEAQEQHRQDVIDSFSDGKGFN